MYVDIYCSVVNGLRWDQLLPSYLNCSFPLQPEGGVLLQCRGKCHGMGHCNTTGQLSQTNKDKQWLNVIRGSLYFSNTFHLLTLLSDLCWCNYTGHERQIFLCSWVSSELFTTSVSLWGAMRLVRKEDLDLEALMNKNGGKQRWK